MTGCTLQGGITEKFKGHYRPPLTSQERAEKEAKRLARQQNDNRVEALLRQLAGNPLHQQ